jgi:hypothetical protein
MSTYFWAEKLYFLRKLLLVYAKNDRDIDFNEKCLFVAKIGENRRKLWLKN